MLAIAKMFDFSASHILARPEWNTQKNHDVFGKCSNPNGHGHNYRLEVVVSGVPSPETGMLIDTSRLTEIVERVVVNDLDHRNLNLDVAWLEGIMPSTENVIAAIWQRLQPAIDSVAQNAQLERLVLWETRKIYAIRERGK